MTQKPTKILLSDLTHTQVGVSANYFPLGISYVASYLNSRLGERVDVELFKYPEDLADHINTNPAPAIVGFSNYSWSFRLTIAFAERIKEINPQTVTVFGGPNYPIARDEQEQFLRAHPAIDFHIDGEGEEAFLALYQALAATGFDAEVLKRQGRALPSIQYMHDGRFIDGPLLERLKDLEQIPSPYLNGLMDKFFDGRLTPILQMSRGCPYSCTFCHDGIDYMRKIRRFDLRRTLNEIDYIRDRRTSADVVFADLNFGMFKDDELVAKHFHNIRKEIGWPISISFTTAKNHKDALIRIAEDLGEAVYLAASVQSTDPQVLANIRRTNISLEVLAETTQTVSRKGSGSISEIILCLPGDSKQKHMKSVFDVMDIGIKEIRLYQFILLAGTAAANDASRRKYEYQTRFRVLPRCYGRYDLAGRTETVYETHEVCVGNSTMPHTDYLLCRQFDYAVSIFNNGGLFDELYRYMESEGVKRSMVFRRVFKFTQQNDTVLRPIYREFERDEERNFWVSKAELDDFLGQPATLERYMSDDLGGNQMMRYRARAILEHLDELAEIIFGACRGLLEKAGNFDAAKAGWLADLQTYLLAVKGHPLNADRRHVGEFDFDFIAINRGNFEVDPFDFRVSGGIRLIIDHSDGQKDAISTFLRQYGDGVDGFGHFLQRVDPGTLYRRVMADG